MTAPSDERSPRSRATAGRVLIPVLVGLVLGVVILAFMQGGWDSAGGDGSVVQPGSEAASDSMRLPMALPDGMNPSQVEVMVLPPPEMPMRGRADHRIGKRCCLIMQKTGIWRCPPGVAKLNCRIEVWLRPPSICSRSPTLIAPSTNDRICLRLGV